MKDRALLIVGAGMIGACPLLMVMVIANTQATMAPIVLTFQFS